MVTCVIGKRDMRVTDDPLQLPAETQGRREPDHAPVALPDAARGDRHDHGAPSGSGVSRGSRHVPADHIVDFIRPADTLAHHAHPLYGVSLVSCRMPWTPSPGHRYARNR